MDFNFKMALICYTKTQFAVAVKVFARQKISICIDMTHIVI